MQSRVKTGLLQIVFLLVIYPKSRQDDLTSKQKKQLRALAEKAFK